MRGIAVKTAAGLVLGFTACYLMFFGLAWGGYAIFTSLEGRMGVAGAAGITAAIFLLVPLVVLLVAAIAMPRKKEPQGTAAIMSALASVARDKPLFAIATATLFGVAEVLMNRRWRRKKDR